MVDRPLYPLRDAAGKLTMTIHNREIEVVWGGGRFFGPAVHVGPPVDKARYWAQPRKDGQRRWLEELPPVKRRVYPDGKPLGELRQTPDAMLDEWGDEPEAWRPKAGDVWPLPLPEPLAVDPDALRVGRIGKVDFSTADMAAEMEHDRNRRRIEGDGKESVTIPPWRSMREPDPARPGLMRDVKWVYSQPRHITPAECRWRVMRALYWIGGNRIPGPRCMTFAQTIAARMPVSMSDLMDEDAPRHALPPLVRHPSESDDMLLLAMEWVCNALSPDELQVLVALTADRELTMSRVAKALDVAEHEVRSIEQRAFKSLVAAANGFAPPRRRAAREKIINGNRAHKRNAA